MLFETKEHYAMRYVYGDHRTWGRAKTKVIIGMKSHVDHVVVVNGGHWNPGYNKIIRFWSRKADEIGIEGVRDLIAVSLGSSDINSLPSQAWTPSIGAMRKFAEDRKQKALGEYKGSTYHPKLTAIMRHLSECEVRDILLRFLLTIDPERVDSIPVQFFEITNADLAYALSSVVDKGTPIIIPQVILDNLID
ncbi:MAG: hypothetical protein GY938_13070 [Ketobacter sp.]|nr:hypothetical protein [Ketobacter sp.]